jgi:hypothetical protein
MVRIEVFEAIFSHVFWPILGLDFSGDILVNYEHAGVAWGWGDSAFGVSCGHYSQPPLEDGGEQYLLYSGYCGMTYAGSLPYFNYGIRMKVLWEVIGEKSGDSIAFDLGAMRSFSLRPFFGGNRSDIMVGLSLYNLGSDLKMISASEPLPVSIQAGWGWSVFMPGRQSFRLFNDWRYFARSSRKLEASAGLEYGWFDIARLRLGFDDWAVARRLSLGAGMGYTFGKFWFELDYAFVGTSVQGGLVSHSLTLTFKRVPGAKKRG